MRIGGALVGLAVAAAIYAAAPVHGGAVPRGPVQGGQEPRAAADREPRAAAVLHPDTVRVGEPFTLGVIVQADPAASLVFPVRLELPEELEQRGPVEVRSAAGDGTWRAYYRLVAWRPGPHELPPLRIAWRIGVAERVIELGAPPLDVASVLPAEGEEAELRGPRPFLRYAAPLWPWFVGGLLALLAAAAAAAWWRRRERPEPARSPVPAVPPAEGALRSLVALRTRWLAGEVDGAGFFDDWEAIVRRYVEATRGWPAGVPLRALADGHRPLAVALERSTLVRFARLAAERDEPPEATAVAIDWIRAQEREWELAEAGDPAGVESVAGDPQADA